ncbi:enoyl-CoA hydratase/isomerase family protein [Streptomyces luteireticuli]|uniref:Enoyl-CoA hydratase/isomerase family protein n=1 Tax=Streptomyces luteireticuli TaxID=173858 RepID=A0ABN0YUZ6_9ACTN
MEPALHLDVDGTTATIRITNPAKRNAMTPGMWRSLPALLDRCAADPAVRVVVLTGEGDTFCAGADISSLAGGSRDDDPRGLAVAAEEALAAFPKPTLAAVRGHCVGGGCQLATACDLRFAADGAVFGVTPARLGIVYAASSTRRLTELVGPATAKYLLFSAELIGTERALRTGLVDEVWAPDALDGRVAEFASTLASRSLLTQVAAKEFASGAAPGAAPEERTAYWAGQGDAEMAEGRAAFLERRAPRFAWRVPAAPGAVRSALS